jgi:pimeloyl-ACP methyl ester carboxylesterase
METRSLKRSFGEITYYVSGSGPTLLGISGFGCSFYNYIDLASELSKNFRVILIDNRGMGKSSQTSFDYTLSDVAADALAVMDDLNINEFGLMGISMGGFIAQELIKLAPNRVKALILMCTLSGAADFIHPISLTEEGLRQFNTFDIKTQAEFTTMSTVHPSLRSNNPVQYQKIIDLRIEHKANIEEIVRQNRAAVSFLSSSFDCSLINCPTLAMAGANDRFVNPENVNVFAKKIAKCQVAFIDEADHFFFLEKPLEVASNLSKFFKEVL